ncbi:hypothetical protein RUM43_000269, partial [Polyplax serrata]
MARLYPFHQQDIHPPCTLTCKSVVLLSFLSGKTPCYVHDRLFSKNGAGRDIDIGVTLAGQTHQPSTSPSAQVEPFDSVKSQPK